MADHEAHGRAGELNVDEAAQEAARLEAGRLLFAQPCRFVMGVVATTQLPPANLPEVAFAGRSNVGKSSLLNALLGRKDLARTSNTPGRTQEVNLFELGGRLTLVDLPGYGYAKAPKDKVEAWTGLVHDYLRGRPSLLRVLLLIDARRGLMPVDEAVMTLLGKAAVPYMAVLTKSDLMRSHELETRQAELETATRRRAGALPSLAVTSSRKSQGLDELRAGIAELAAPEPGAAP